jgi:hypothetical protein
MTSPKTARSARECFDEYTKQVAAFDEIADFCHVQPQAVASWRGERWPRGEQLYLLWVFFELRGYTVAELEKLSLPVHQLLLMVAQGVLSFDEIRSALGYSNLQSLFRLFLHGSGMTAERVWKLEVLVRQHLPALESLRSNLVAPAIEAGSDELPLAEIAPRPQLPALNEQSSLVRLLRLVVKRSGEIEPEELKRQLREVPRQEVEAFALLLLEII